MAMNTIDVTSDDALSLREASLVLPRGRNGSRPHLSTLIRWITRGAPAPDGCRVKLAAVRCGGKWVTSRQALREFCEALTPAQVDRASSRTSTTRQRASQKADEQLERVGI
jgi:hypothetical protein